MLNPSIEGLVPKLMYNRGSMKEIKKPITSRNWSDLSTTAKIFIVLSIVFILAFIGSLASSSVDQPMSSTVANTEPITLDQSAAESFCQDASLLGKYINLVDYSIIDIWEYAPYYYDSGSSDTSNPIMVLQWNGKNKQTKEPARFKCAVSGQKGALKLHWLRLNDSDLYGSASFE